MQTVSSTRVSSRVERMARARRPRDSFHRQRGWLDEAPAPLRPAVLIYLNKSNFFPELKPLGVVICIQKRPPLTRRP